MEEKRVLGRDALRDDALSSISVGVALLQTVIDEHFGRTEKPDNWGEECVYQRISGKIEAAAEILWNAKDLLSVAENNKAGEYFNDRAKLISDIIGGGGEV